MTAEQVIDALMDYIRSSDSAIVGSKGPRKRALIKALDTYIDNQVAAVIRRSTITDARSKP